MNISASAKQSSMRRQRRVAMSAAQFEAWLKHVGFSDRRAATILQISRATVAKYRREGAPAHIGYACTAIALGLSMWEPHSE